MASSPDPQDAAHRAADDAGPATWVLTGSPDNFAATAAHGFRVVGFKQRRRNQAQTVAPGDRIVFYLTKQMAFAGAVQVTGELFEDRTPIWPGKPGNPDPYPWRFPTRPELVLAEDDRLPAELLKDRLHHIGKWPAEHWKLAFQGQVRTFDRHDSDLVLQAMASRRLLDHATLDAALTA
jgi:hypothetical protein